MSGPRKHGQYCFCTDCCEARDDTPADFPDYDEWRRAFPELPWDNGEVKLQVTDCTPMGTYT